MAQVVRLGLAAAGLGLMMASAGAVAPLPQKPKLQLAKQQPAQQPVRPVVPPKVVAPQVPAKAPAVAGAPAASSVPVLVPGKPVLVALTGDWSVFAADLNGIRTCYSATQPKDTVPRQQDRLPAYVYLTSTAGAQVRHGLTIKLGIAAQTDGVSVNVDGHEFKLRSKGDVAYAPDNRTEADLLLAMRRGHTMMLHTTLTSPSAGAITDSISLLGVDDSVRMIDQACTGATASR